jgi:hypothetical protein
VGSCNGHGEEMAGGAVRDGVTQFGRGDTASNGATSRWEDRWRCWQLGSTTVGRRLHLGLGLRLSVTDEVARHGGEDCRQLALVIDSSQGGRCVTGALRWSKHGGDAAR